MKRIALPGKLSPCPFQAVGVADQFIQHVDDLAKLWPFGSFLLPAVQHQLVQGNGAVHGWRQPVTFLDSLYHLRDPNGKLKSTSSTSSRIDSLMQHLHPGYSYPNRVALRMTSPPT